MKHLYKVCIWNVDKLFAHFWQCFTTMWRMSEGQFSHDAAQIVLILLQSLGLLKIKKKEKRKILKTSNLSRRHWKSWVIQAKKKFCKQKRKRLKVKKKRWQKSWFFSRFIFEQKISASLFRAFLPWKIYLSQGSTANWLVYLPYRLK